VDNAVTGPYRIVQVVTKFNGEVSAEHIDAGEVEPFETVLVTGYYEANGTPITHPERIADVERLMTEREQHDGEG